MARKHSLPLLHLGGSLFASPAPVAPAKPSVDAIRKRLGGRASTEPGAGELVELPAPTGEPLRGVVLFARGDDLDVWIEQPGAAAPSSSQPRTGVVRRARRDDVGPLRLPAPRHLDAVAADARVFGALVEGQRIRYQDDRGLGEGILIEKCRFGGLVGRDDGIIVGVGFRRIWPAQRSDEGRN